MRVLCYVEHVDLENDDGHGVQGVEVTCSRCEKSVTSFGTSENSIRRCYVLLKDGCDEQHYYYNEEVDR